MNEFQRISIYIQAHNLSNIEEVTSENEHIIISV